MNVLIGPCNIRLMPCHGDIPVNIMVKHIIDNISANHILHILLKITMIMAKRSLKIKCNFNLVALRTAKTNSIEFWPF